MNALIQNGGKELACSTLTDLYPIDLYPKSFIYAHVHITIHSRRSRGPRPPIVTMDLSPRMRFYFRWGQKCALFRAAPIIAVEERGRVLLTEAAVIFSEPFTPV